MVSEETMTSRLKLHEDEFKMVESKLQEQIMTLQTDMTDLHVHINKLQSKCDQNGDQSNCIQQLQKVTEEQHQHMQSIIKENHQLKHWLEQRENELDNINAMLDGQNLQDILHEVDAFRNTKFIKNEIQGNITYHSTRIPPPLSCTTYTPRHFQETTCQRSIFPKSRVHDRMTRDKSTSYNNELPTQNSQVSDLRMQQGTQERSENSDIVVRDQECHTPINKALLSASIEQSALTNILKSIQQHVNDATGINNSKHFKKAQIPFFYGKPDENIKSWLFMIEERFEADHIKDEDKVSIAMGYIRECLRSISKYVLSVKTKMD